MTASLEWVVAALRSPFERLSGRASTADEANDCESPRPRGADDETVAAAVAALEHCETRGDRRSPPDIDGGADDRTVAAAVAAEEGRDVLRDGSLESRPTPPDIDDGADDETVAAAVARVDPRGDAVVQADGPGD